MEAPNSIHDLIKTLMDTEKPFPPHLLHYFSDIQPEDRRVLANAWRAVPASRRITLMQDLVELAETDHLLMFEDIGRIALEDEEGECKVSGISLLLEAEDPKLVPSFTRLMADLKEPEFVRAAAANALGFYVYLGELEELMPELLHTIEDALLSAYKNDPSELAQRRALESLGYSCREEVPALLRQAAAREKTEWLESALFAMGKSADNQWESLVMEHIDDDNLDVRGQAIHAAGELALSAARSRLLRQVDRESDEYLRSEMIWALSQIGGEGIEEKFEAMLAKTDDDEEYNLLEEALDMLHFTNETADFEMMEVGISHGHASHDEDEEESELWDTIDDDDEDDFDDLDDFDEEEWQRYVDEDEEDLDGSLEDSYTLDDDDDDEDDL